MEMNHEVGEFAIESNIIEGITNDKAHLNMADSLKWFLKLKRLTVDDVVIFALELSDKCVLRDKPGMNVVVAGHYPVPGDDLMPQRIKDLIFNMGRLDHPPFVTHHVFEYLHPFMDGNGRTGRAIWLWQMLNEGKDVSLGFLHTWYYQSLDNSRG